MDTLTLTYLGPHDEVEILATGQTVRRDEQVEVSAETAGRAPSGDPDDPDDEYDPGEGLLAQDTTWVLAGDEGAVAAKKAAAAERRAERKAAKEAEDAAALAAAAETTEGDAQ